MKHIGERIVTILHTIAVCCDFEGCETTLILDNFKGTGLNNYITKQGWFKTWKEVLCPVHAPPIVKLTWIKGKHGCSEHSHGHDFGMMLNDPWKICPIRAERCCGWKPKEK